jgi:site-specific recombinase XerD
VADDGYDHQCTPRAPPSIRQICAAWLVSAGAPVAGMRDRLGLSTIQMTERYAQLAPENLRSTVARFESHRHTQRAGGDMKMPTDRRTDNG